MRPALSVAARSDVDGRPGPLGVDVVGGDRRDAAPVVDARGRAAAPGRRRGSAAPARGPRRAGPAGRRRSSSTSSSGGHGGCPAMAVPGLGRKFWTITSWTWPWRRWESAMASRAARRSSRVSPMPTRMPGGEGDGQLARPAPAWPAGGRGLVRGTAVGGQLRDQRLDHHALAGRHRPQRRQLVAVQGAGVGVGEQPGLLEHQRGTWPPGSRRSSAYPCVGQPPGGASGSAPRVARPG